MRAVNLLPEGSEARKSFRKEDPAVVIGSALGVVVLIALVGAFLNVHSKVNSEQAKLTAARTELAKLSLIKKPVVVPKPVIQKTIIPPPAVTSEEQPLLTAITSAMSTRIAWDRILREISQVLPSDVTLGNLTLTAPPAPVAAVAGTVAAPATGATGLSVTGSAFSSDGVARLLSRLMLIPDLSDVTLSSSSASSTAGGGVSFSITAGVKGAPALPPLPAPVVPTDTTTDTTASS
jgi:Tfp pilus assembly protein PilN